VNRSLLAVTLAVLLAAACPTRADSFVETFVGAPVGYWTFLASNEAVEATGGNPGPYLHAWNMDTFMPQCITTPGIESVFVGNYRERMVTAVGVDVTIIDVDWPDLSDRPLTLALVDDGGTPMYPFDDWAALSRGPNIPDEGAGWASYDYDIPYDSPDLPAGWTIKRFGGEAPEDPDWNDLITNVSYIGFAFGDPDFFYIYQMWDVGVDNPRISWVPEPVSLVLLGLGAFALLRRR